MKTQESKSKKRVLRERLSKLRDSLSKEELDEKSLLIFDRLKDIEAYKNAKGVLIYSSFKNEVKTKEIIKDLEAKGKSVFLPVIKDNNSFIACRKSDLTKNNKYGISEPYPIETADLKSGKIDLIICPGVGFDYKLNRIGHGKGYYDRFLMDSENIIKIGLAYKIQMADNVYPDNHDVPMDIVVTEEKTYL